jgi:hypothetical protein
MAPRTRRACTLLAAIAPLVCTCTTTFAHADDSGVVPSSATTTPAPTTPASGPAASRAPSAGPRTSAPPHDDDDDATETRWNGWQTLLVDAGAVTAFVTGVNAKGDSATLHWLVTSAGLYVIGAPLVHLAHGRGQATAIDLGVRIGAPLILAGVGLAIGSAAGCSDYPCGGPIVGVVFGGALGVGAAVIVDAVVLGREKVPRPGADGNRAAYTPKLRIAPTAGPLRGGATAGVVGSF